MIQGHTNTWFVPNVLPKLHDFSMTHATFFHDFTDLVQTDYYEYA